MTQYLLVTLFCISGLAAQDSPSAKPKLQSMVLPGWGEQSLGEAHRANGFFIREAALWITYFGSSKAAGWYASDYNAFAELHADVDMAGKNYLFVVNLAHYNSLEEFNTTKEQQRAVNEKYAEGKGFEWQWDSTENRIKYDEMRISSANYKKIAKFSVGGLVLHRLISFFDVLYLERQNMPINLSTHIMPDNTLQLQLSLDF